MGGGGVVAMDVRHKEELGFEASVVAVKLSVEGLTWACRAVVSFLLIPFFEEELDGKAA